MFSSMCFLEKTYMITALLAGLESWALALLVLLTNKSNRINQSFFAYGFFGGLWGVLLFFCVLSPHHATSLLLNRILHAASILIVLSTYIFTVNFLGLKKGRMHRIGVAGACVLMPLTFTPFIVEDIGRKFLFQTWPLAGPGYSIYLMYFSFYSAYSMFLIFMHYKKATGVRRTQLLYVLTAFLICYVGGATNFAYTYSIPIPPVGNFTVMLYVFVLAYAILRYRLMDIRVVLTRAGIFFSVYTIILGLPIWLGFKMLGVGSWVWPISLMGVLATIGPSIYIFLRQRAESGLLAEQRHYQQVLRQASAGMGHIRELDRLYKLIAHILTRTVLMESALIYVLDDDKSVYKRVAMRQRKVKDVDNAEILKDSLLVSELIKSGGRLFLDEIRFRAATTKSSLDKELERILVRLDAVLIFAIFIEDQVDTFVVMGPKISRQPYTEDDMAVFSILANQAALAIENAKFYDHVRHTQEQLFRAEKMATIGTMADGVSHQINNRFHVMGFIAGDVLDSMDMYEKSPSTMSMQELLKQIRHGLSRIQENVDQGSQVVRGLLDYSRSDTKAAKEGVDLHKLIKAAMDMVSLKIHLKDFDRHINIPTDVARVEGNFVQLQEVFFNIIDNAYFSMMEKKSKKMEKDYVPAMTFEADTQGEMLKITVADNGMGIKEEDQKKLFTPFFTTKVSSRKGNGLGLYVMRKIIEDVHGGSISFTSDYGKGVSIEIVLPVVKNNGAGGFAEGLAQH